MTNEITILTVCLFIVLEGKQRKEDLKYEHLLEKNRRNGSQCGSNVAVH